MENGFNILFGLPFLAPKSDCFVNNVVSDIPESKAFLKLADYLVPVVVKTKKVSSIRRYSLLILKKKVEL